jgi:hypothetical protein
MLANRRRDGLFYTWFAPRWPPRLDTDHLSVVLRPWRHPIKQHYFWKLNESARDDVDGVVNANVLLYLGVSDATRPVVRYLARIVRDRLEDRCDKWHLNPFTFYYAVGRTFAEGARDLIDIRDEVVSRIVSAAASDGRIGRDALDTALAICALRCWDRRPPELDRALTWLVAAQRPTGEWPRIPMYYGGPQRYYGWGSEELTTGFCLEALAQSLGSAA